MSLIRQYIQSNQSPFYTVLKAQERGMVGIESDIAIEFLHSSNCIDIPLC